VIAYSLAVAPRPASPKPGPKPGPAAGLCVGLLAGLAWAGALPGCVGVDETSPSQGPRDIVDEPIGGRSEGGRTRGARGAAALEADRLEVHPLTRLTRTPAGELQLALHLDPKDRYGHSTKALGRVRVELYRPGGGDVGSAGGGAETQELVWDVDLRDAASNALLYDDMVTRTYVLHLGGLPGWMEEWVAGRGREPWITLKVRFSGATGVLEAGYRMQR